MLNPSDTTSTPGMYHLLSLLCPVHAVVHHLGDGIFPVDIFILVQVFLSSFKRFYPNLEFCLFTLKSHVYKTIAYMRHLLFTAMFSSQSSYCGLDPNAFFVLSTLVPHPPTPFSSSPHQTEFFANLITNRTSDAGPVHAWISSLLPDSPHPPLVRPINYTRIIVGTTAVLGLITFGSVAWPYVWPFAQSRNLWAALSLLAVLLFTSGQMFNHIRKVPYVTADGRGGLTYFAGGFQNQLGMETQIVAAICE